MRDLNETFRSLNMGLPNDVERLKAAGYYTEPPASIAPEDAAQRTADARLPCRPLRQPDRERENRACV